MAEYIDQEYEQALAKMVKYSKDDGFAGELVRAFMRVDPQVAYLIREAERKEGDPDG